jgi:hypothetical protein
LKKIDHTPAFDGIEETVASGRRNKIAVITLFATILVFMTMAGVIYGVMRESDEVVSLHLFILPLVIAVALYSYIRVSQRSTAQRQRLYLENAKKVLAEDFDLDLDLGQVKQLGLGEDWRALSPGAALGSTGTLSDFPSTAGRYHSIVAVKLDETSVGLFETKGETVIVQL